MEFSFDDLLYMNQVKEMIEKWGKEHHEDVSIYLFNHGDALINSYQKSHIEVKFEWSDNKTYNLKVDMDLKVATSMKDVESADHLFVLADSDGEGARGVTSMSGGKVMTLVIRVWSLVLMMMA